MVTLRKICQYGKKIKTCLLLKQPYAAIFNCLHSIDSSDLILIKTKPVYDEGKQNGWNDISVSVQDMTRTTPLGPDTRPSMYLSVSGGSWSRPSKCHQEPVDTWWPLPAQHRQKLYWDKYFCGCEMFSLSWPPWRTDYFIQIIVQVYFSTACNTLQMFSNQEIIIERDRQGI